MLGHEHYSDVRNGLIYVAIVAPFGMFALALAVRRFGRGQPGSPAMLPALALFLVLLSTGITYISNSLSRAVEARADSFALRETNAPDALIALQKRLVIRNVSDPEPPWLGHGDLRHAPAADGPDRDGAGLPGARRGRRFAGLDLVAVACDSPGRDTRATSAGGRCCCLPDVAQLVGDQVVGGLARAGGVMRMSGPNS